MCPARRSCTGRCSCFSRPAVRSSRRSIASKPAAAISPRQAIVCRSISRPRSAPGKSRRPCWRRSKAQETTDSDLLDSIAARFKAAAKRFSASPQTEQTRPVLLELEWKLAKFLESQPHHADRQVMLAKLQMGLGGDSGRDGSVATGPAPPDPNFVEAHHLRAQLHVKMGEIEGTIDILKGLLKRSDFAWPDIHYQIAELEQKSGRAEQSPIAPVSGDPAQSKLNAGTETPQQMYRGLTAVLARCEAGHLFSANRRSKRVLAGKLHERSSVHVGSRTSLQRARSAGCHSVGDHRDRS